MTPDRSVPREREEEEDAQRERLIDLLVSYATEGLSESELELMNVLRHRFPDLDVASFLAAAAIFDLAFVESDGVMPLPDSLSRKLRDQAAARGAGG